MTKHKNSHKVPVSSSGFNWRRDKGDEEKSKLFVTELKGADRDKAQMMVREAFYDLALIKGRTYAEKNNADLSDGEDWGLEALDRVVKYLNPAKVGGPVSLASYVLRGIDRILPQIVQRVTHRRQQELVKADVIEINTMGEAAVMPLVNIDQKKLIEAVRCAIADFTDKERVYAAKVLEGHRCDGSFLLAGLADEVVNRWAGKTRQARNVAMVALRKRLLENPVIREYMGFNVQTA